MTRRRPKPGDLSTGPASAAWLRETLERLGLSQVAAARLLGVSSTAVYYWTAERRPISVSAARFLEVLDALPYSRRAEILATYRRIDEGEP